jgi:3-oxoacyl-[acyl-carrier-protein] synthase II
MDVFVEGIGIVGGFGEGMKELSAALGRGKVETHPVSFGPGDAAPGMPAFLADTSRLDSFVPKKALRRIDHYSKMALLGSYLALEDASPQDLDPKGLGIVVASGYGASATTYAFLDSFIEGNDAYSSPTHFANSVHNAAAAHISILLGATGPCLTVSQREMSVPSALISALHWLKEDRVEKVLFGAVDEYCNVLGYSWRRFFGVNESGVIEPFLFDRQSAVPGEGAAFFLLSRKKVPSKGYGHIQAVESECHGSPQLPHEDRTLFILGADGHRQCGPGYGRSVTDQMRVTSYTPLFGSFLTNMAFDMAVACLSMKEGKVYGPPPGITLPSPLRIVRETGGLDADRICCLKFGGRGESATITMALD